MRAIRTRPDPSFAGRGRAGFWPVLRVVFLLLGAATLASACGTAGRVIEALTEEHPPPDSTIAFTVFLIGDAGNTPPEQLPTLRQMAQHFARVDSQSAVVFLGDNIYPSGMPPEGAPTRADAEERINNQIETVRDFPGRVIFIPGNHDWGGAGLGGNPAALIRQKQYVEAALDRGDVYLPDGVFPGPSVVELTNEITLVAIDTQWWLEDDKRYGDTGQYFLEQETEFLLELDDVLNRYSDTNLLVVAHHPVFTNGPHGGYFPTRHRLNPVIFLSRAYLGTPQDLSNYKYRRLREGLLSIFERHEDLIFAAGHEHALQYFHHGNQHHIVSGSGSKDSYVAEGHGASFVYGDKGFATLNYYTDGSIWLTFWGTEHQEDAARMLYRTRLKEGTRPLVARDASPRDRRLVEIGLTGAEAEDTTAFDTDPDTFRPEVVGHDGETGGTPPSPSGDVTKEAPYAFFSQGSVAVRAAPEYRVGPLTSVILGDHYRDVWALPIEVPIIDLERTAGGLTPIRRGGGLQTLSLHLQGVDGDSYVVRSINKDPNKTIPPYLAETLAHDVVRDQISAMHPYGAFILPRLADAAGIYHTQPTLVYVPDDERLGRYREEFAGVLALFETRPDEEQRDEARFGNPENIIGTPKLIEEIEADNDHFVDQSAFARARLFDMLIGDWDRHSDQWRWAAFEPYERDASLTGEARTQGKIYVPIPRDRDYALFKFDGLIASLARRSDVPQFRRYTNFFKGYDDLFGLNYNGVQLDRRFTSALSRDAWIEIAEDLRARLTDDVIAAAVRDFPPTVFDYHGEEIAAMLRKRRDELPGAAANYFDMLAHVVDVVGSNKHERFEVTRLNDDETEVVMYATTREGTIRGERYRRTIRHTETDEVRLYGLDGDDTFIVRGSVNDGVLLRIIGGPGADHFVDSSRVRGRSDRTIIYDTVHGNTWEPGPETRVVRSNDPANNAYVMHRLELDRLGPFLLLDHDVEDGFEIGGGLSFTELGFRRSPFAARHRAGIQYSTLSRSFNVFYQLDYTAVLGQWDGHLRADYMTEGRFRHFYGLSNESDLEDRFSYPARLGGVRVAPTLERSLHPFADVRLGPRFEYVNVERWGDRPTRFTDDDFTDKYYTGLEAELEINGLDSLANARYGARWLNQARAMAGVRNTSKVHVRLLSEFTYYYTFDLPSQVTAAFRVGAATNIGRFDFFHANTLGGETNLRGFRKTRFAGRTSFYQNLDLRIRLTSFNAYLTRGDLGVLAFVDNGRVWADGEDSGRWHHGFGGGVWVSPFYRLVLTGTAAWSRENTILDVSIGFLF